MEHLHRSPAYDDYWRFAAKRHHAYLARLEGQPAPWTSDPIIASFRFTNTFRAVDRVSQFLIRDILYNDPYDPIDEDVVFRTLLFKIFNNIGTWQAIEQTLGPISWRSFKFDGADKLLDSLLRSNRTIYSAAYIMPAPPFGAKRKHTNHLLLLKTMMEEGFTQNAKRAQDLKSLYRLLLSYPGLGQFLAYQYTIDLNYSSVIDFDENDFVVAGPGAHDGIRKCFPNASPDDAERIIHWMVDNQDSEFSRLGITFNGLFGRKLKAIDCQNIFCEISKYSRVAYPELVGTTGRTRIKQTFKPTHRAGIARPFFPPKWGITVDIGDLDVSTATPKQQLELYA